MTLIGSSSATMTQPRKIHSSAGASSTTAGVLVASTQPRQAKPTAETAVT
jgi:hypothetical protein